MQAMIISSPRYRKCCFQHYQVTIKESNAITHCKLVFFYLISFSGGSCLSSMNAMPHSRPAWAQHWNRRPHFHQSVRSIAVTLSDHLSLYWIDMKNSRESRQIYELWIVKLGSRIIHHFQVAKVATGLNLCFFFKCLIDKFNFASYGKGRLKYLSSWVFYSVIQCV